MYVSADYVACKWRYPPFVTLIFKKNTNTHKNGDCTKEIQARLRIATGTLRSLDSVWKTGPYTSRLNKDFCQH